MLLSSSKYYLALEILVLHYKNYEANQWITLFRILIGFRSQGGAYSI